ncbi:MAG: hypothetical protein HY079_00445 [Elusimicrobia bacterium]|nr:hypothetical protein [Elusimicrobiota bacterium]
MKTKNLILGLILAACAAAPRADAAPAKGVVVTTTTVQLVFPNPPDRPRVRWVRSIRTLRDLKGRDQNLFEKVFSFIAGGDVTMPFVLGGYGVYKRGPKLYVADTPSGRVAVLDLDKKSASYVGEGTGDDGLKAPVGVVVDEAGTLFVTDPPSRAVKAYGADGKFRWAADDLGVVGGKISRPAGIALTPDGNLLVADTGNRRILLLSREGKFVREMCVHARQEYYALPNPNNVWVEKDGSFLVTDPLAARVHVFSSTGAAIGGFGEQGDTPGYLARPRGVAVDSDGNIHLVDALFSRVQIFNRKGDLLLWYAFPGDGRGQLALPAGLFIDSDDMIYVMDSKNQRVQVFQYITYPDEKPAAPPAASSGTAPAPPQAPPAPPAEKK